MKMYPSQFGSDALLMLQQICAALVSADFDDVSTHFDLFRDKAGVLKGVPCVMAGPEERRAEFEEIFRSFDPNGTPEAPVITDD